MVANDCDVNANGNKRMVPILLLYIPQNNNCKVELYKNGALNSYEPMET